MSRLLTCLFVIALLATAAPANVVFEWEPTTEPGVIGGGSAPTGYTAYDLYMTVDNDISAIEMYIQASPSTTGTFYQHALGTNWTPTTVAITGMVNPTPPPDWFIVPNPELEFDTYMTLPVDGSASGAAINIVPGVRGATFDDQLLDQRWAPNLANSGSGKHLVARVTVKDDMEGSWQLWGQETGPIEGTASGVGPLFIPEPATVLVLLGGALLVAIRRR